MKISVITPSIRPKGLETAFLTLSAQTMPRDEWEWLPRLSIPGERPDLCKQVNAALQGNASPQVSPWTKGELAIVPHDLRAALYVLFADHISGRTAFLRACEHCQRYFFPGRSDQRFCSVSCRKKHHYEETKGGSE